MADSIIPKELSAEISETKKAKGIDPSLINQVLSHELRNSDNKKLVIKAVKAKLYQVSGAFRNDNFDYLSLTDTLSNVSCETYPEELKNICLDVMQKHASTRERIPFLQDFYSQIFSVLPPIGSVIDLACGLNPFAIPWMTLNTDFQYDAWELFEDIISLINLFFDKQLIKGTASQKNLLQNMPDHVYDLAFVLKTIPCLEQIDKYGGRKLLSQLSFISKYAVISFPGFSLSGKNKGMPRNYEAHFMNIIEDEQWEIQKISFPAELVFILKSRSLSE